MTYKELFKDYYATNALLQFSKDIYLYSSISAWAETSPAIKLIFETLKRKYTQSKISPDELIALLKDMGFPEWPNLEKFIADIDGSGFKAWYCFDIIDPAFPLISDTEEISKSDDLYQLFLNAGFPLPVSNYPGSKLPFIFVDTKMEMPTDVDIQNIIKACPSDIEKYSAEGRDCDDYSRIFLGWLSRKGHGNLTFGWIHAFLNYENGNSLYHSFCWAISKEGNVWLFDPQNDERIWKHGEQIMIPNVISIDPVFMGI